MTAPEDLDVVIVNHCSTQACLRLLRSIRDHGVARPAHIVVVDHSETPDPALAAGRGDDVGLIRPSRNGGFAAGVNIGAAAGSAPALLILNADMLFVDNPLGPALDLLSKRAEIGAIGLDLQSPAGSASSPAVASTASRTSLRGASRASRGCARRVSIAISCAANGRRGGPLRWAGR
ncbi:glycosyltransferase [Rhizobium sp. G21]|uniref:glycosyltransferase n=1 Tax=Rhizobium sp. G21 TaxID=2758439 RepID=UPI0016000182|nr:glycosyltransferase [Rhizobium sp. G21]MBB1250521.1 glycosyltransferase [Rhizobium sp. G21]